MNSNLILFGAGLLGLIFFYLGKANSLQKDFAVANQPFILKKFFEKEAISIAMSVVALIIVIIVFPEFTGQYPGLSRWTISSHVFGGACGTWLLSLVFGKTKTFIRGVVDTKTNIADKVIVEKGLAAAEKEAQNN
jgi:hypothetical protein